MIVMFDLTKQSAVADPDNLKDLGGLAYKFPDIK
jgi:hypothetical protein